MAFTYFFRDLQTLELLAEHFVPYVAGRSRITVWDAGCAMGPEPYTLAIVLAERMNQYAYKNLRILATDLDNTDQFGKIVTDAEYPKDELVRIPPEVFGKYFVAGSAPDRYRLCEDVRARVAFRQHDLLSMKAAVDGVSAIVCKNVLLHFQPNERVEVIRMFHGALAPGGLIAFEHTQEMPKELGSCFRQLTPDARVYQRIEA